MDLATIIGLIGAFALVVSSMVLGGDPMVFINIPSILVVVGGTFFAVMMKFGLKQFISAFGIAFKAFSFKCETPEEIIAKSVELATAARKGGLLALEEMPIENKFMAKGVQFLVDGLEPDVVKGLLDKEISQSTDRHDWGQKVFTAFGDVAPAMGMIGTLIGLVQMLAAMDDPKSIGPAMAVALLTTLYGAMIANMVCLPIADKLNLRSEEEKRIQLLSKDALIAIQAGQNPRIIQELLKAYLSVSKRGEEE